MKRLAIPALLALVAAAQLIRIEHVAAEDPPTFSRDATSSERSAPQDAPQSVAKATESDSHGLKRVHEQFAEVHVLWIDDNAEKHVYSMDVECYGATSLSDTLKSITATRHRTDNGLPYIDLNMATITMNRDPGIGGEIGRPVDVEWDGKLNMVAAREFEWLLPGDQVDVSLPKLDAAHAEATRQADERLKEIAREVEQLQQIESGYLLGVTFHFQRPYPWGHSTCSVDLAVNSDGEVHLPNRTGVKVAGLTLDAASQAINSAVNEGDSPIKVADVGVRIVGMAPDNCAEVLLVDVGNAWGHPVQFSIAEKDISRLSDILKLVQMPHPIKSVHLVRKRRYDNSYRTLTPKWLVDQQELGDGGNLELFPGDRIVVEHSPTNADPIVVIHIEDGSSRPLDLGFRLTPDAKTATAALHAVSHHRSLDFTGVEMYLVHFDAHGITQKPLRWDAAASALSEETNYALEPGDQICILPPAAVAPVVQVSAHESTDGGTIPSANLQPNEFVTVYVDSSKRDHAVGAYRRRPLAFQILCSIIEILPNGNFSLFGQQTVYKDGESQRITLSGEVLPEAILPDRTVSSRSIANLNVDILDMSPEAAVLASAITPASPAPAVRPPSAKTRAILDEAEAARKAADRKHEFAALAEPAHPGLSTRPVLAVEQPLSVAVTFQSVEGGEFHSNASFEAGTKLSRLLAMPLCPHPIDFADAMIILTRHGDPANGEVMQKIIGWDKVAGSVAADDDCELQEGDEISVRAHRPAPKLPEGTPTVSIVLRLDAEGESVQRVPFREGLSVADLIAATVLPKPIDFAKARITLLNSESAVDRNEKAALVVGWSGGGVMEDSNYAITPGATLSIDLTQPPLQPPLPPGADIESLNGFPPAPKPAPGAPAPVADGIAYKIALLEDISGDLAEFVDSDESLPGAIRDTASLEPALRVLKKHGLIKTIADPKILTQDGRPAEFNENVKVPGKDRLFRNVRHVKIVGREAPSSTAKGPADERPALNVEIQAHADHAGERHTLEAAFQLAPGQSAIARLKAKDGSPSPLYLVVTPEWVD